MRIRASSAILACAAAWCAAAHGEVALDRISVEAGAGNAVDMAGVNIVSSDWARWPLGDEWSLALYGKTGMALWVGRDGNAPHKSLVDFSAYPVWRFEHDHAAGAAPYIELAIGGNLLTSTRIDSKDFSTAFQFGEFAAAGVAYGDHRQYDVSVRVQHVSNGDIKRPNDGITFVCVAFQYRFR